MGLISFLEFKQSTADLPSHATIIVSPFSFHPLAIYFNVENIPYRLVNLLQNVLWSMGLPDIILVPTHLPSLFVPSIVQAATPTPFMKDPLLTATAWPLCIACFNSSMFGFSCRLTCHCCVYVVPSRFSCQEFCHFCCVSMCVAYPVITIFCCGVWMVALLHCFHCGLVSSACGLCPKWMPLMQHGIWM